ncbi:MULTISPECIES: malonate decarboxylase subunit epsilon [Burkholderia]|uniref:malonate decarboxylase subunit epsilon n=1 Tax=Burkholderia TaxID=32008 RepID=UPI00075C9C24|nr:MULTISPECIES: malonate decarboxylase subunit epsilon [Burkholderia]AOJ69291.1 malonate decarboxylase subunit epsilon [Burkholderia savannae]KVG47183.1 malonate decarboxylase subunit epsilon [Burkholderia sp. MSMB0265]KVG77955.1 malonate decarboxylase subunit epsilon [Burkholderia sp. MSMB2040]KVG95255.1 malonate decarboxylase subunit epsilon [Burkholderia sp. MSMB2042]KVG99418.1 malonate decarboxylase subunit epsilon [Burkholderia sp. MSMB2041]
MTIAILCSGQGGQRAGMFELTADVPQAAPLFAHAAALLGADPREWARDAGDDALRENFAAQLVCTLQALSAMTRLDALLPRRRCVAGYSVGEVAAWGVAGLVDARDALDLVAARARAMDAASDGDARMLFARGLPRDAIDALCTAHGAAVAIVNPGDAYVLAGPRAALDMLAAHAREKGAARVAPVCVRVASHTRWLDAAVPRFRAALADVRIARAPVPGTRLLSGIDGAPVLDVAAGVDKLARQIAEPIDWAACLAGCVEAGARAFVELGPGRALADMAAAAYPALPARSLADFRSWDGVRAWFSRVDPGA